MSWNALVTEGGWPKDWPPLATILERKSQGDSWSLLAAEIGVMRKTLQRYVDLATNVAVGFEDNRAALMAQNRAFEEAMHEAIEQGKERARIGIFKDPTPHPIGRLTIGDALFSGCGSSAWACVQACPPDPLK